MRDRNVSGRTVTIYRNALAQLEDFLLAEGLSMDVGDISRDHMRAFLDRRLSHVKVSRPQSPTGRISSSSTRASPRVCSSGHRFTTCARPW